MSSDEEEAIYSGDDDGDESSSDDQTPMDNGSFRLSNIDGGLTIDDNDLYTCVTFNDHGTLRKMQIGDQFEQGGIEKRVICFVNDVNVNDGERCIVATWEDVAGRPSQQGYDFFNIYDISQDAVIRNPRYDCAAMARPEMRKYLTAIYGTTMEHICSGYAFKRRE